MADLAYLPFRTNVLYNKIRSKSGTSDQMIRTINLQRLTKYSQPHLLAQQLMNQATGSLGDCGKVTSVEKLEGSLEHSGFSDIT